MNVLIVISLLLCMFFYGFIVLDTSLRSDFRKLYKEESKITAITIFIAYSAVFTVVVAGVVLVSILMFGTLDNLLK